MSKASAASPVDERTMAEPRPIFSLQPVSADSADSRVFGGPRPQRFNLAVFDPSNDYAPLKWSQLLPSHMRRIHVAFASSDLSSLVHVHPEDFAALNAGDPDAASWAIEATFNRAGKWGVLVEYDTSGGEEDGMEEGEEHGHGGAHHHHRRHGHDGDSADYRRTYTGTALIDVLEPADSLESGADQEDDWPKATLMDADLPPVAGSVQFRGLMLAPAPDDHKWTLPIIAPDLQLDKPTTPRSTALVNQTFLATLRTVPAVIPTNSCVTAILEFFFASGDKWAPVTTLAPFLEASGHITTVHSSLGEVGHSHTTVFKPSSVDDSAARPDAPIDASLVPDMCSSDDAAHSHKPDPVFGPRLAAPLRFSTPGKHAVFLQSARLQDGGFVMPVGGIGRVMLAPRFVVEVGSGKEATTGRELSEAEARGLGGVGEIPQAWGPDDGMKGRPVGQAGSVQEEAAVPPSQGSGGNNAAAIAVALLFALAAIGGVFLYRRTKRRSSQARRYGDESLLPTNISPIFAGGLGTSPIGYEQLMADLDFLDDDENAEKGSMTMEALQQHDEK